MNDDEIVEDSQELQDDIQPYTKYFKTIGPMI